MSKGAGLLCAAAGLGAVCCAMAWAYWPALTRMVGEWMHEPDYSHGFLVGPLAILFLWARREQFPVDHVGPNLFSGLIALVFVGVCRVVAGLFYLEPIDAWTLPLWLGAAVLLLFGWSCLRWCWPSLAFLYFMIPLPYSVEEGLSVPLQRVATEVSTVSLQLLGQPAIAEGNTIWLGERQLFVEEACSGLRIFVGVFALAFAYLLFTRWSWWQKLLVLLAAVPVALLANSLRIVVTALLNEYASGEAARAFNHDLSGIVMIPLAAFLFWLLLIYLGRLFPEYEEIDAATLRHVTVR